MVHLQPASSRWNYTCKQGEEESFVQLENQCGGEKLATVIAGNKNKNALYLR